MSKLLLPTLGVTATLLVTGIGITAVKSQVDPPTHVAGLDAHETNGAVSLIGQFRTSVSGWLWVRTDLYMHNGVQMRPLTEMEKDKGRTGTMGNDGYDQDIAAKAHITVIPSKDRDFRGVFGDIERATNAYRDMTNHAHNDPQSALPLFRLMTWLDPEFIPGWTVGASVICRESKDAAYNKALDYLNEGLEHNPKSVTLHNEVGYIYVRRLRDIPKAQRSFETARANIVDPARMNDDDRESGLNVYRWLCLVYRDQGLYDKVIEVTADGLSKYGEDYTLRRQHEFANLVKHPITREEYYRLKQKTENQEKEKGGHDHEHGNGHDHDHGHSHDHGHEH
jgi:tetratricopeptide (TPR) repeat protein